MRNANRLFSVFLASLFLVSLVPTPTNAGADLGPAQEVEVEKRFGGDKNAPYGAVGKMLEEVDLYLHSEALSTGDADAPTEYAQRFVDSIVGGAPPPGASSVGYEQISREKAVANFRQPEAMLNSLYHVVPDPSPDGCAQGIYGNPGEPCQITFLGDDPQKDAANKRVRLGYLDPDGYAPTTPAPVANPGTDPAPDIATHGFDAWEAVSFLTPAELAAEADFRIYDVKLEGYATCATPNNLNTIDNDAFGDLVVNVYRTDAFGKRILDDDGLETPLMTVYASADKFDSVGNVFSSPNPDTDDVAIPTAGAAKRYTGSFLQSARALDASGIELTNNVRAVPNFYLDEGIEVKQGERLEFELGLDYVTSLWVNDDDGIVTAQEMFLLGENIFFDNKEEPGDVQPISPYNVECFLHYDTFKQQDMLHDNGDKDASDPNIYKVAANDPASPVQSIQFPGRGYESRITIIADTLRASTWITDTTNRLTSGLGNGDTFNVQSIYASAWGSLALDENRANQPKALDGRVSERFRSLETLNVEDFGQPGLSLESQLTTSTLLKTQQFQFAPDTKAKVAYVNELFVDDPTVKTSPSTVPKTPEEDFADAPLRLLNQIFEGAAIAASPSAAIGKTGMNFFLAAGEPATHQVNPGESTIFTYTAENLGSSADTITIIADAVGGGWTAQVLNSRQLIGGGGSASVNVLVTPPSSALAGAVSPAIKVRAISSFADIITPKQAQDTFVSIVAGVVRTLDLTSETPSVALKPSETRLIGVSVRNAGTSTESILVGAAVPADISGWSIRVLPPSKQVVAGGRADYQIELRAPNNAPANLAFPLTVTARVVGDGTVQDVLSIPVKVVGASDLVVSLFPGTGDAKVRHWGGLKDEGPLAFQYNARELLGGDDSPIVGTPAEGPVSGQVGERCIGVPPNQAGPAGNPLPQDTKCLPTDQDPTYSDSVIVPILLENTGTLDDTYTIKRSHIKFPSSSDCWKYRFAESGKLATAGAFTDKDSTPFTFFVPAGKSKVVDLELICLRTTGSGPRASSVDSVELGITVVSSVDATLKRGEFKVKATTIDPGTYLGKGVYTGRLQGVDVHLEDDQPEETSVLPNTAARYIIRAQNVGNERDVLTIRASQPPIGSGWTQTLTFLNSSKGGDAGYCTQSNPLELKCGGESIEPTNLPAGRYGLRAGEEVLVALDVTPGAFVPLGNTFKSVVSAASGADGSKTDIVEVATTATGTFVFDVLSRTPTLNVERGATAMLPFTIRNRGTSGDDYSVSLISGNADFKPRLSVPDTNFVPGGSVLHGFLTVTAPATATV
ncbi:MAG: hypothetical protein WC876_10600, partial [Candidatus Thermoplasmatota archaeon]